MDNRPYITKTMFALSLGMSIRSLQRRAKQMKYTFQKGLVSPTEQDEFKRRLEEWERNRALRNG